MIKIIFVYVNCSVVSDSLRFYRLWLIRLLCPWNSHGRILEWVAITFSGDLPNWGMQPESPAFQADSVPSEPPWKPQLNSVYDKLSQQRICLQCRRPGFTPWVRKILWKRKWQTTPVFLPGKSHGHRSLAGYSPGEARVWHDLVTKPPPYLTFRLTWEF